jgi:hypothetical protein
MTRRIRLHGHLWSSGPGIAASYARRATVPTFSVEQNPLANSDALFGVLIVRTARPGSWPVQWTGCIVGTVFESHVRGQRFLG